MCTFVKVKMAKAIVKYFCKNCGHQASKWLGKCPSCEAWNSFTEEVVSKSGSEKKIWGKNTNNKVEPKRVKDIE
jgi:DNA repair protein RadA/Sms